MKNRFNNITSKEWLPFQKSWFIDESDEILYTKNIRFFIKYDDQQYKPNVFFMGSDKKAAVLKKVVKKNEGFLFLNKDLKKINDLQYIIIDLRDQLYNEPTVKNYNSLKAKVVTLIDQLLPKLKERRFISVIIPNVFINDSYFPFAWDLSYQLATGLSLKDEKVGCLANDKNNHFDNEVFFILNFRKDQNSTLKFKPVETGLFNNINSKENKLKPTYFKKRWAIIRPKRRNKKEILHPAKYPENLIEMFIETFTIKNENVFDPMTGTASTQLAAMQIGRNGYGTELSTFFTNIAIHRLNEFIEPAQIKLDLFNDNKKNVKFNIINKDVRDIKKDDFPEIDYIITSPPYWDMLNMKGAENQAKRKEKGLKINYSNDNKDFGNIADYDEFIIELCELYFKLIEILKPGGAFTIIIKNIKKKGKNYPFAYDLARILQKKLILMPEFFWLQDDINLAPYGYGNTFVSNTFHQYCLTFKKPLT